MSTSERALTLKRHLINIVLDFGNYLVEIIDCVCFHGLCNEMNGIIWATTNVINKCSKMNLTTQHMDWLKQIASSFIKSNQLLHKNSFSGFCSNLNSGMYNQMAHWLHLPILMIIRMIMYHMIMWLLCRWHVHVGLLVWWHVRHVMGGCLRCHLVHVLHMKGPHHVFFSFIWLILIDLKRNNTKEMCVNSNSSYSIGIQNAMTLYFDRAFLSEK